MVVAELIAKLSLYPQDLPVMLDGYESGITETITILRVSVLRNQNSEWYYGEHEIDEDTKTPHDETILLSREV